MKTYCLLTFFVCFLLSNPMILSADPVTRERAASIAESFFKSKGMVSKYILNNVYQAPKKDACSATAVKANPNFYVFNADTGYVIVSGSDNTPEILGYSLNGNFDYDKMPCNMKSWLDYYSSQIEYAEANDVSAERASGELRKPIEPLLTCKWGQHEPYNLKCPVNNGMHCVTGCVATALSQVMYYYKWPERTTQDIPGYTLNINGVETEIPAVPAGTEFDWGNMLPTYYGVEATETQQEAVATLMSVVGTALDMMYNTGESGAFTNYLNDVPKTYFGYSENQELVSRADIEEWETLIYNELAVGHPVIYNGTENNSSVGHCFVVDGYDGDQLFHVDWGWETYEGYYLLDVLDPYAQNVYENNGDGYQRWQTAVINLVPAGQDADADYHIGNPADLTYESFDIYGTLRTSEGQDLVAAFSCKEGGFYGDVNLYVSESPDFDFSTSIYLDYKGLIVKRKETGSVSFSWIPEAPGKYYLFVVMNTGEVLASTSVEIAEGPVRVDKLGLRFLSAQMSGQDFKTKKVDPTDENASLVDVISGLEGPYLRHHDTQIRITNMNQDRWEGNFTFAVEKYNDDIDKYETFQTINRSGWASAGATWNFEMTFYELPEGKYRLAVYVNDELLSNSWHFNAYDGAEAWTGPNGRTMLKIEDDKLTIPEDVLAVDLRLFSDLNGIIPNNNPNTIYIVDVDAKQSETFIGRNVVIKRHNSDYAYNAENIQLQDGYPYFSPYTYDVGKISFVKRFDKFSTLETQHWTVFSIPFTASDIMYSGRNCIWAHDDKDEEGNFWLQKLSHMSDDTAYFVCEDQDSIIAWRPYIVAVPDGMDEIVFSAENIKVNSSPSAMPRTENYRFVSDMSGCKTFDLYVMDESTGDKFSYKGDDYTTMPFGAYFMPVNDNIRPECILIEATKIGNIATSIESVYSDESGVESVYNVDGQKLPKVQKGLNIIRKADGTTKKIVVR